MAKSRAPLKKPNWLKNPWPWGLAYGCLILLSHCSEFDPNEVGLSGFGKATTVLEKWVARRPQFDPESKVINQSAQKTIDRLRMVQEPTPTPIETEVGPVATTGITAGTGAVQVGAGEAISPAKKVLYGIIDIFGFRQNWRLFQSPHPEVQGYEVRAYNRIVVPKGNLYEGAFRRCLDLDDLGLCEPSIGSRLEFEMLRQMEKRRSPMLFRAFSEHMVSKISNPINKDVKKIEFVVYRHAFKLSKDFSKRGSAQILFSEDLQ